MKFQKTLLACAVSVFLAGCSSDDDDSSKDPIVPEPISLKLVVPAEGKSMVEDFPLAMYVTYPEGEQTVSSVTSIDVNWPSFDVFQSGVEYGYVDGDSNELFYHSVENTHDAAKNAIDLERQDDILWYVTGDNLLNRYDRAQDKLVTWQVSEDSAFTELAIDETGEEQVWLYDQNAHQLVIFNAVDESSQVITLAGDMSVEGLAVSEDNMLILAQEAMQGVVLHYSLAETLLTHTDSWYIEGFGAAQFNDIGLMPDGRIAISNDDTENNLVFVMDKNAQIGAGPIEDTGELEKVAEHALDEAIIQPSGIWALADDSWMIITDQAEMFAMDANFKVTEKVNIEFDSINCNQGCTEAIVGGDNEFFAMTDGGLIGHFTKTDNSYTLAKEYQINVKDGEGESYSYSGLGYDVSAQEYYLVPDQNDEEAIDELIILNSDFTLKKRYDITYSGETEGSIFEYDAQGVQYHQGNVYVLSEKFTKLIKLNLVGEIVAVYDLDHENVSDPSDIALKDGQVYVLGDHENDEPVPPLSVFDIVEHD